MPEVLDIPTREEQKVAKATLKEIKKSAGKSTSKIFLSFEADGNSVVIPTRI